MLFRSGQAAAKAKAKATADVKRESSPSVATGATGAAGAGTVGLALDAGGEGAR